MDHTQGKLAANRDWIGREVGGIVAIIGGFDGVTNEANARRLVACWNALEGVPTEWLENYVSKDVINVIQENAKFRKAAEDLIRIFDQIRCLESRYGPCPAIEDLRAAMEGK